MYNWGARKKIWIFTFLGAMALLLLYPFKTTVVPEWRVRIVDEAGNLMRTTRSARCGSTTRLNLRAMKRI
jgi:hypothetical protein